MAIQTNFQKAHAFTAKWEGGLSDHPVDRGGITAYGVSIAFLTDLAAKKGGSVFLASIGVKTPITKNTIRNLNKEQATAIFKYAFWDKLFCDSLPLRQACVLYDMAVNHGPGMAVKLAQRGCNLLGKGLAEDGIMGPKTRAALDEDSLELALAIIQKRKDYYQAIVDSRPSQKVFLRGWLNRANDQERYIRGLL